RARGQVRCLLVEDSFVISMDTMRIMNEAGLAKVQTAMTVRDAMQAIDAERPDFAALDVNLSGGETSHGVANRLKAMGVPFVFVTGYGSEGVPRDAFDGIPVLRKPLHRADLEPVLQDFGL
ncbi:MAG: response regulator, partial [Pseudomonadota bacterium]